MKQTKRRRNMRKIILAVVFILTGASSFASETAESFTINCRPQKPDITSEVLVIKLTATDAPMSIDVFKGTMTIDLEHPGSEPYQTVLPARLSAVALQKDPSDSRTELRYVSTGIRKINIWPELPQSFIYEISYQYIGRSYEKGEPFSAVLKIYKSLNVKLLKQDQISYICKMDY
jgi:hypothetical protein